MTLYLLLPPTVLLLGLIMRIPLCLRQRKKVFLGITFLLLFFLMAFRAETVGTDTASYARIFKQIGLTPFPRAITDVIVSAPVYSLLCKAIYSIVPRPYALSFVTAAIVCVCFAVFFYHFSDNVVCSVYCFVTLWFYFTSFNINRQFVAVSLIVLAYVLSDQKKWIGAVAVSLLAIGVHNTAALAIPFLFLIHKKYTVRDLFLLLGLSVVFVVVLQYGFTYLALLFSRLFPRYAMYFGGAIHSFSDTGRGDNIYLTLFYLAFIALAAVVIFKNTNRKQVLESNSLTKLFMLAAVGILLGLAMASNLALDRVRNYFLVSMCCLIPNTINRIKHKFYYYCVCDALLLAPYLICLYRNISGVVPYQTIWS